MLSGVQWSLRRSLVKQSLMMVSIKATLLSLINKKFWINDESCKWSWGFKDYEREEVWKLIWSMSEWSIYYKVIRVILKLLIQLSHTLKNSFKPHCFYINTLKSIKEQSRFMWD